MIEEKEYLKAKQIVQEYEKQLNISDVRNINLLKSIIELRTNCERNLKNVVDDLELPNLTEDFGYLGGQKNELEFIVKCLNNIIKEQVEVDTNKDR